MNYVEMMRETRQFHLSVLLSMLLNLQHDEHLLSASSSTDLRRDGNSTRDNHCRRCAPPNCSQDLVRAVLVG